MNLSFCQRSAFVPNRFSGYPTNFRSNATHPFGLLLACKFDREISADSPQKHFAFTGADGRLHFATTEPFLQRFGLANLQRH
jgi:hypothetical protein